MFAVRLYLSKLYGALKFGLSPVLTFATLGIPVIWTLIQRKRLQVHAVSNSWRPVRAGDPRDKGILRKDINGMRVEVWPNAAFGAKVFVHFSTVKAIEIDSSTRRDNEVKKTVPFDSGDSRFDLMFPLHRGRKREVEGLMADPDAIRWLVKLRSRWMFAISDLQITRHYIFASLRYGTALAFHLPPRILEPFTSEISAVAARWDKALGSNGEKITL